MFGHTVSPLVVAKVLSGGTHSETFTSIDLSEDCEPWQGLGPNEFGEGCRPGTILFYLSVFLFSLSLFLALAFSLSPSPSLPFSILRGSGVAAWFGFLHPC